MSPPPIRLGVSACLVGERVRYDGRDKLDPYIRDTLGRYFTLMPICPEVAIGLGIPRPPIHLVGSATRPRAVGVNDASLEVTSRLAAYGEEVARTSLSISGYILKSRSPSCGKQDVEVRQRSGKLISTGRGIYAASLMKQRSLLPVIDESELASNELRDNFLERVFAFHRWTALIEQGLTPSALVDFHAAHKLALLAHSRQRYTVLGQLVAGVRRANLDVVAAKYGEGFLQALMLPTTRRRHTDVLMHASGFLKRYLTAQERRELREQIERYRTSAQPLIGPIALLRNYFRQHPDPWIEHQVYLYPDTRELALRYS